MSTEGIGGPQRTPNNPEETLPAASPIEAHQQSLQQSYDAASSMEAIKGASLDDYKARKIAMPSDHSPHSEIANEMTTHLGYYASKVDDALKQYGVDPSQYPGLTTALDTIHNSCSTPLSNYNMDESGFQDHINGLNGHIDHLNSGLQAQNSIGSVEENFAALTQHGMDQERAVQNLGKTISTARERASDLIAQEAWEAFHNHAKGLTPKVGEINQTLAEMKNQSLEDYQSGGLKRLDTNMLQTNTQVKDLTQQIEALSRQKEGILQTKFGHFQEVASDIDRAITALTTELKALKEGGATSPESIPSSSAGDLLGRLGVATNFPTLS
ncbi:MAG: hypothetical protein S4CHLAM45_10990 [Chlamydiales bacterium]|nr:hypothetical protein [Chlamydiales bacterium]MCH9619591.1 hypothetical protein [Chlamydiales bacterium]MCH9623197.1 hypothetical protein [Chlamydiales bacterium]